MLEKNSAYVLCMRQFIDLSILDVKVMIPCMALSTTLFKVPLLRDIQDRMDVSINNLE